MCVYYEVCSCKITVCGDSGYLTKCSFLLGTEEEYKISLYLFVLWFSLCAVS